ncbi:acyl-CoA dehydrogenase family protein [Amycolatopsis magusensis]|uniref:acyl-CoA dehydrogenase family protein n=1 Tax=Amycolatopsis magusensis TaxID=882444 RepID=UPI00379DFAF3
MPEVTGNPCLAGELSEPATEEGAELLALLSAHAPQIRADAADNDRTGAFPVEIFENLRKDGVLGATVPKELGGIGVSSLYDVALALRLVGEADASTALALHMQLSRGLTLTYEWRHGSPAARSLAERLLTPMGSGDAVVCTTVKDAVAHRIVSKLTKAPGGGWILSGRKMLASMSPIATVFVISAQTDIDGQPPRQVSVVVPREAAGLTVLENWDGLGMRASGSNDIVMDQCAVADEDVFFRGPVGEQEDSMLAGQTVSSITMLGIYVGVAQAARDIAFKAVRRRSDKAAVRTLVSEVDARLHSLRAAVGTGLALADAPATGALADPAERGRRMMTSFQCAKLAVNRFAPEIVGDCLTLVGGASYVATNPLSRLYRDVRAGSFMHPFTYADAVDYLSAQALER